MLNALFGGLFGVCLVAGGIKPDNAWFWLIMLVYTCSLFSIALTPTKRK